MKNRVDQLNKSIGELKAKQVQFQADLAASHVLAGELRSKIADATLEGVGTDRLEKDLENVESKQRVLMVTIHRAEENIYALGPELEAAKKEAAASAYDETVKTVTPLYHQAYGHLMAFYELKLRITPLCEDLQKLAQVGGFNSTNAVYFGLPFPSLVQLNKMFNEFRYRDETLPDAPELPKEPKPPENLLPDTPISHSGYVDNSGSAGAWIGLRR